MFSFFVGVLVGWFFTRYSTKLHAIWKKNLNDIEKKLDEAGK